MHIESLPVSQLKPAPYNPRVNLKPGDKAWEKLERSLNEFELVQPIVWNRRTGHVVSGHQRLEILKHRGDQSVECAVVDLPLNQEKALNVTLNNSSVGSDWDSHKLIDLVAELQDLPDFDATLTGFDEQQLNDILLAPAWDEGTATPEASESFEGHRVTLEVPEDNWEEVRYVLDNLLRDYPHVRMHVEGN